MKTFYLVTFYLVTFYLLLVTCYFARSAPFDVAKLVMVDLMGMLF